MKMIFFMNELQSYRELIVFNFDFLLLREIKYECDFLNRWQFKFIKFWYNVLSIFVGYVII